MIKKSTVKTFIDNGFNVIGVSGNKIPVGEWKVYQKKKHPIKDINSSSLAIVCGKISGNLELIDVDCKYDITGTLHTRLFKDLEKQELLDKLISVKTENNGYHLYYRCSEISGNRKLARRPLTKEEKIKSPKEKFKVLIETRGEGGYALAPPSKGYSILNGKKLTEVQEITPQERDAILSICRSYDEEHHEEVRPHKSNDTSYDVSPFEDYNNKEKCEDVLVANGWSIEYERDGRIYLKRAGSTKALYSGNVLISKNLFMCFSSSTEFETEKAYSPSAVFNQIKNDGDWTKTYRDLYELGYGERKQAQSIDEYANTRLNENKRPKDIGNINDYLVDNDEDDKTLDKYLNGEIVHGRSTGSKELDNYFRFKDGKFIVIVGHTNVGKTVGTIHLLNLDVLINGKKGILYVSENKSWEIKVHLMQWLIGKPLKEMTRSQYNFAKDFVNTNYTFIKARGGKVTDPEHFLELAYKMAAEYEDFSWIFADPYSSFIRNKKYGENDHSYDSRISTEFLNFTEATNKSLYLSQHTNTESRRRKDEAGLIKRPYMDDADGGGKWANRADTVMINHRKINAEFPINTYTEIHIDKERNKLLGGDTTQVDRPVLMEFVDECNYLIAGENVCRKYADDLLKKNGIPVSDVTPLVTERDMSFEEISLPEEK